VGPSRRRRRTSPSPIPCAQVITPRRSGSASSACGRASRAPLPSDSSGPFASDANRRRGVVRARPSRSRLGQRAAGGGRMAPHATPRPRYEDAELQLLALGIDSGLPVPPSYGRSTLMCRPGTAGDSFEIHTTGGWRPFYVEGHQSRRRTSGHFPSDFSHRRFDVRPLARADRGARANAVRVYTILPPAFYRSLKVWNDAHPIAPCGSCTVCGRIGLRATTTMP